MDEVLSCRWVESCDQQMASDWSSAIKRLFSSPFLFSFCRPAMIRSQLRSALRRCPTEEGAGPAGGRAPVLEGSAGGGAQVGQLQSLIAQRMQRAQELLEEMRLQV